MLIAPLAINFIAPARPEKKEPGNQLLPPITACLLDDFDVDPETKRVLGVALEKTRVSLGLADDFADGIIAKRLIELAKAGEHNPDLLCQGAIEQLRGHLYGD